ncbi:PEP-CTERM sorting domain-containing protein [Janthinobacterium sp. Mn2066]|uniref:PEP-CTERM sorting domain-containing protein n=1 Tax=Janthinobacterium sp. Mn2066 TaxID=3395264 RepID=UPI003BE147DB
MRKNNHRSTPTFLLAALLSPLLLSPLAAQANSYTGYYVNPQAVPPAKKPNCSQSMQDDKGKAQNQATSGVSLEGVSSPCSLSNGDINYDEFKNDGVGPGTVSSLGDDAAYHRSLASDDGHTGVKRLPSDALNFPSVASRPLASGNGPAFSAGTDSFNATSTIQPFQPAAAVGWRPGNVGGTERLAASSFSSPGGFGSGSGDPGLFGTNPPVSGGTGTPDTPGTDLPAIPPVVGPPVVTPPIVTPVDPNIPAIPEASTWAMLLAGLGLVSLALKRRRH